MKFHTTPTTSSITCTPSPRRESRARETPPSSAPARDAPESWPRMHPPPPTPATLTTLTWLFFESQELIMTARAISATGKGILAADESTGA